MASVAGSTAEPIQTFSIGFQEKQFSELPCAEEVARHFGTLHREQVVTPDAVRDLDDLVYYYDEPFADASAIPTMAVARMAAQHVKVCLSGDGGDEAFGGYARYSHDMREGAIRDRIPAWMRRLLLKPMSVLWPKLDWLPRPLRLRTLLQNLSSDPAAAYANTISACRTDVRARLLQADFRHTVQGHRPESFAEQLYDASYQHGASRKDTLCGMLATDTAFFLPDDFLVKTDRASMACGLEVRPPLIDWQLMELTATMPSEFKVRNGSKKWMLKELFESRLPKGLAHRRKQGFELPVDNWLRGPLQEQVREVVLKPDAAIGQYISTEHASRIFDAHCRRTGRHGQLLWSLLVLGRWLEKWGSGPSTTSHREQIHSSVEPELVHS